VGIDDWLINRRLTTLPLHIQKQSADALVQPFFWGAVPGWHGCSTPDWSHPHHAVAKAQMGDFGGVLTFQLKGGLGAVINLAEKIRFFQYATSLSHAHSLLFSYPTDIYIDAVSYLDAEHNSRIRI
jgi:cystathionine beta-lyase/cystathionine gamma-synthase